jgi:serine/threonine protein kinase
MDFGAVTTASGAWAPYMILEWLKGRSLAEDLAQRRRARMGGRTLDEALAILEPAAEGLSLAHQRRVAHRDVKPANIFLLEAAPDSRGPRVKVLDFGIAKIIRDGEGTGTRSPFASFTWLYAAPEQLDPRIGQTGLATDVYSFALLLSELLTDRVPAEGRDVVALLKASTDPTIRPTPRQCGANVPDGIEVACRRALAVDPAARFANIGELWAALVAARRATPPPAFASTPSGGLPSASALGSTGPAPYLHVSQGASRSGPPPYVPAPYPSHTGTPGSGAPRYAPPAQYPMAYPAAAAMSPPPMSPPPGTGVFPMRARPMPQSPSSIGVVLAVIALVVGMMFVGTCSVMYAACQ